MAYDAARYFDPITFGWLVERGLDGGMHCHPCGRHAVVPVRSLPFALETPVPATAGQMHALRVTTDGGTA